MVTLFKELVQYANRFSHEGKSRSMCALFFAVRATKGVLFGYNPNFPFPLFRGNERRGLIGQCYFDFVSLVRWIVHRALRLTKWIAIVLTITWFLAPTETSRLLRPIVEPLKRNYLRSWVEIAMPVSVEVRKGLHLAAPPDLSEALVAELITVVQEEDAKVTKHFGQEIEGPVLIEVGNEVRTGKEAGTVVLGQYHQNSRSLLGSHYIEVSLVPALARGVIAHELTHVHVEIINPKVNLLLNEGMAHYVEAQDESGVLSQSAEEMVAKCHYPSDRHWSSTSPRSKSDTIQSRALGYVVVHFLHTVKGYPIAKIPVLEDRDLPSVGEICDHLQALKLQLVKRRALGRQQGDINLSFWIEAYLSSPDPGKFTLPTESKSTQEAERFFQNLMDLSVQHLRWSGLTDEEISAMTPEAIMKVSEDAIAKLPERLDELGVSLGEEMYDFHFNGINEDALRRLIRDSYAEDADGQLFRAMDQGWARVFVRKSLSPNEPLPPYSSALLDSIVNAIGPPSPARRALSEWSLRSRSQDLNTP